MIAWLALIVASGAAWMAYEALTIARACERLLTGLITKVETELATLQAERANDQHVRQSVHQRTAVWGARGSGSGWGN